MARVRARGARGRIRSDVTRAHPAAAPPARVARAAPTRRLPLPSWAFRPSSVLPAFSATRRRRRRTLCASARGARTAEAGNRRRRRGLRGLRQWRCWSGRLNSPLSSAKWPGCTAAANRARPRRTAPRTGGLLAFTGPAGLGKTTLLREIAARVTARGGTVVYAYGGEQEGGFHVIRRLLRPLLPALDERELRALLGSWYDLAAPAAGLPAPGNTVVHPEGVRRALDRLFAHPAVRDAPFAVIVDDAHWADPASLAWLARFAPRAPGLPLLCALGYDPQELRPDAAGFRAAVDGAAQPPYALSELSTEAVAELAREIFARRRGHTVDLHPPLPRGRGLPRHPRWHPHRTARSDGRRSRRRTGRPPGSSVRHLLEVHPDGGPAVVGELRRAAHEYAVAGAPDAACRCLRAAPCGSRPHDVAAPCGSARTV
ncbi:ATP-binding protein [Streptomyces sp. CA-250714]|uniref:ATP-binding protein n=1 Tax=Streptomyces sp. CA-250714 TaxID=3240060 RepID=UPI003D8C2A57